jgi:hypothetical protein
VEIVNTSEAPQRPVTPPTRNGRADGPASSTFAMMTVVARWADSGGMKRRPPRPADSAEPAGWLLQRVDMWHGDWVTGVVGSGFETYARLFILQANPPARAPGPRSPVRTVERGVLCGVLARHTCAREHCYFAGWEEYGSCMGHPPQPLHSARMPARLERCRDPRLRSGNST